MNARRSAKTITVILRLLSPFAAVRPVLPGAARTM